MSGKSPSISGSLGQARASVPLAAMQASRATISTLTAEGLYSLVIFSSTIGCAYITGLKSHKTCASTFAVQLLAGAKRYLLAHIRRWKSDATFFKQLRKSFAVEDITKSIDSDADAVSSHTRGASRLFQLTPKQDQHQST